MYFDIRGGIAFDNLNAKIESTLSDQEDYLKLGGSGHRDPNKFWVSQAVLHYNAISYDGHSQNYLGAKEMNRKFLAAYKNRPQGRRSDGTPDSNVDYAGYFTIPRANDRLYLF